jgi:hypothetical protein
MSDAINKTPTVDFYIWQGAPKPIVFNELLDDGITQFQYPSTTQLVAAPPGLPPFTLTVGQGITLSMIGSTANAGFTALLTPAQSFLVAKGKYTPYKIWFNDPILPTIYMAGFLFGEGI